MKKQYLSPDNLFDSTKFGFSQIVISNPGKMVFISGQVAWDENQNIVGKNDLAIQTQKSIDNLKTALSEVGGSLDDVVMLRIYIVNHKQKDGSGISQILKDNFTVALFGFLVPYLQQKNRIKVIKSFAGDTFFSTKMFPRSSFTRPAL